MRLVDSTPDWVGEIEFAGELRGVLGQPIETVMGRYRGQVDAWDVANEPLETLGTGRYNNIFNQLVGPGHMGAAL